MIVRKNPPTCPTLTASICPGSRGRPRLRCWEWLWVGAITGHGKRFCRHLFADTINARKDKRVGNVALPEQGGQQANGLLLTPYQIKSVHS